MEALVLAAGRGTRLAPLTDDRPKCLLDFGGKSLLQGQVDVLSHCGVTDVTVVTGYRSEQVERLGYRTIFNPEFATCNMVRSLFCAWPFLSGTSDLIISYGDLVFEPKVIRALFDCTAPLGVVVDQDWLRLWSLRTDNPLADADKLIINDRGLIGQIGKNPAGYHEVHGQYVGLLKLRQDCIGPMLEAYMHMDRSRHYDGRDHANMFMTSFIQHLVNLHWPVQPVLVKNGSLEFDSVRDYTLYNRMLRAGELRLFYNPEATLQDHYRCS